eukprot:g4016.t1
MSVISSGDVRYNIHNCQETLNVVDLKKNSDTEVTVQFLAPFEYIVSPGAILRLSWYNQADVDVQVILNEGPRVVRVIGDFSFLDDTLTDLTGATMTPMSAQNCVSEIVGFGVVDFQAGENDRFTVLGMESPFARAVQTDNGLVSSMVCVQFPASVSADDYVKLTGTHQYLQQNAARVAITHDDTHFELEYNPSDAFEGYGTSVVTQDGDVWQVDSIVVRGASDSDASVVVTLGEIAPNLSVGDTLTITELSSGKNIYVVPEFGDNKSQYICLQQKLRNFMLEFDRSESFVKYNGQVFPHGSFFSLDNQCVEVVKGSIILLVTDADTIDPIAFPGGDTDANTVRSAGDVVVRDLLLRDLYQVGDKLPGETTYVRNSFFVYDSSANSTIECSRVSAGLSDDKTTGSVGIDVLDSSALKRTFETTPLETNISSTDGTDDITATFTTTGLHFDSDKGDIYFGADRDFRIHFSDVSGLDPAMLQIQSLSGAEYVTRFLVTAEL